jgi:hypothetical protein
MKVRDLFGGLPDTWMVPASCPTGEVSVIDPFAVVEVSMVKDSESLPYREAFQPQVSAALRSSSQQVPQLGLLHLLARIPGALQPSLDLLDGEHVGHGWLLHFHLEPCGRSNLAHPTVALERSQAENRPLEQCLARHFSRVTYATDIYDGYQTGLWRHGRAGYHVRLLFALGSDE